MTRNRNRPKRIMQTARVPVVEHADDMHHVRRKHKLVGLGLNAVECVVKGSGVQLHVLMTALRRSRRSGRRPTLVHRASMSSL